METVVLYPCPGMGHLISMVELGKFILHQHPSLSISILTAPLHSFNTGSTAAYIRHISATFPSITFHHLPPIFLDLEPFPSMEAVVFEVLSRSNPHVRRALESISCRPPSPPFIIDLFCTCWPISANSISLLLLLHFVWVCSQRKLNEIAVGLERSGEVSMRVAPSDDKQAVAVLNHESVGGFVTHCGELSVEAVFAAVRWAWPLYAESRREQGGAGGGYEGGVGDGGGGGRFRSGGGGGAAA
ncbi:UNVERIFIED_CONTAM: UDP-glycosyltransferase 88A1 [Sesamum calycinum]|uniref:UDP-glycosyltransferase 88A1 n=1 Tax=Sesamum calycinum TaxID=2727403 RepID=A0AAW2LQP0_9LAMI